LLAQCGKATHCGERRQYDYYGSWFWLISERVGVDNCVDQVITELQGKSAF